MQPNIGEGTPIAVTFEDVYKTDEEEVKTADEVPIIKNGFRALVPYLLGGYLVGALAKYYKK